MYRCEANSSLGSGISNKQKKYLHRLICAQCTKDKKMFILNRFEPDCF